MEYEIYIKKEKRNRVQNKYYILYYLYILCQINCCWSLENKTQSHELYLRNINKAIEAALLKDDQSGRPHKTVHTIVNGRNSTIEKYPWIVQLLNGDLECGGIIVTSRIILTACHCVSDETASKEDDPIKMTVLVGSSIKRSGYAYKPCEIKCHRKHFTQGAPYYYVYDLALILLQKKITWSSTVQPAIFPTSHYWKYSKSGFIVVGFGELADDKNATVMQETSMRYVDRKTCSQSETNQVEGMPVPSHMFCLIGDKGMPTSDCYGDSGSAVMWGIFVVGIVCTGRTTACGSKTIPSMYTDVLFFRKWINGWKRELESKTLMTCEKPRKINNKNKIPNMVIKVQK